MTQLIYDTTFGGFLTAVFEIYERKLDRVRIVGFDRYQPELVETKIDVITDATKADRVWKGLKKKISPVKLNEVYKTFLSERSDLEQILLHFIRHAFNSKLSIEHDLATDSVLQITQIAKQVHREKHRMEAFIRFQQTRDDFYFASMEPDFNVLPLIIKHFKDRYADQHWVIYDRKREYGIRYNKETGEINEVNINLETSSTQTFLPASIVHEDEVHYQQLWKQYFSSVNIGARKNTKLHVRHVPLRYWKYLTEKIS